MSSPRSMSPPSPIRPAMSANPCLPSTSSTRTYRCTCRTSREMGDSVAIAVDDPCYARAPPHAAAFVPRVDAPCHGLLLRATGFAPCHGSAVPPLARVSCSRASCSVPQVSGSSAGPCVLLPCHGSAVPPLARADATAIPPPESLSLPHLPHHL